MKGSPRLGAGAWRQLEVAMVYFEQPVYGKALSCYCHPYQFTDD